MNSPAPISLDDFLQTLPAESHSISILRERFETLGIDPSSLLYQKTARIVRGIDGLFEKYGELSLYHAEWIQCWVLQNLERDEFKQMARIIFERWASPERLEGSGIVHIHEANDAIGDKIVQLARARNLEELDILDLGSGTLGTVTRVLNKLEKAGISADFIGVEFTPALLKVARKRAVELNLQKNAYHIEIENTDMHAYLQNMPSENVDFITASYAIHHLHPDDQFDLSCHAYRCLRKGGALLIADPQEGKSDFNLKVLHREEPEGVFAAFSSPEGMAKRLAQAGFDEIEVLLRDDTNYTGYALAAIRKL